MSVLETGVLRLNGEPVLREVSDAWTAIADATGTGVFLEIRAPAAADAWVAPLGLIERCRRLICGSRSSPFWMRPIVGTTAADVPPETLWLLAELTSGQFLLLAPLLGAASRYSLCGGASGLKIVSETGDPAIASDRGVALYVAAGADPYGLTAAAARAVAARSGSARLRTDKPTPHFVDLFGWCTWDAFYQDVSADKVRQGLASFAAGGLHPRLLILDDGWQSVSRKPSGEIRLAHFRANAQFPGDLRPLVKLAKEEYRVECFIAWHALLGYWGGIDRETLPDYDAREVARQFSPGVLGRSPQANREPWGSVLGLPAAEQAPRFFDDYHRWLSEQGVDGVKVDNQATLEAVAYGQGGRVALAKAYRTALESSVTRHFDGRMINCMGCTTECVQLAGSSVVMRSSDDFWPGRPETHGNHIFVNAHTGIWFGEFMLPDWDMFQSAHPAGEYHAAARAVAGGPVYVSDKPGAHNFELLRKLVLSDGTVLRADGVGRPTLDCLFLDPTEAPEIFKIFNSNRDCGVVGLFNARYGKAPAGETLSGTVAPAEVPALRGQDFAAFSHRADRLTRCDRTTRLPIALAEGQWEIVSFAPVEFGFAALGLADKFNSTGAISQRQWNDQDCRLQLRDGGRFLAWAERRPAFARFQGATLAFTYDGTSGRLELELPAAGPGELIIGWNRP